MAGAILKKRELYIDVVAEAEEAGEIFLYQVDFYQDYTFRTKEFLYKKEEVKEGEKAEEQELAEAAATIEEQIQPAAPLDLFKEQWELLSQTEVPTEVYATDAGNVMAFVMEPLMKKYPNVPLTSNQGAGREFLHDCVSMGRVISMSVFDEEQYLAADIRRRIKERYHDYVDEVKADRPAHIFIRQTQTEEMAVLRLTITDDKFRTKKQVMLNRGLKAETVAARFKEILFQYPEADVIIDAVTLEFYRLFRSINKEADEEKQRVLFSMESMLAALGKTPDMSNMVKTYLMYIKNQEEMRQGIFLPERLYSVHSFYLPVLLSEEKAWKRRFENNTVWRPDGRESYYIPAEGDFKGKYVLKAGKEQFVLKLRRISIQRYLRKYAVLHIEIENYCYPGEDDRIRINELASSLFAGVGEEAEIIELKLKDGKQAYSLSAIPEEGNENQLWLNGLLKLGETKKKEKNPLVLTAVQEKMYCVESTEHPDEEQLIQMAVIKDGIFRKIEGALAKAAKPENNDRPIGSLVKRQKREIKELYELYRYLVVSFGESCETVQRKEQKQIWNTTEENLGTAEVIQRLDRKFGMFF